MSKIWNLSLLCLGALILIIQTACSDNDSESQEVPQVVPTAQWSQTMAGNGETLGAYPDLYSNYWEFTYRQDENSDKIICIKGQYPYCRYMSFSFYNDETGDGPFCWARVRISTQNSALPSRTISSRSCKALRLS